MSAVYLETSAALAWLFGEPRSESVRTIVEESDAVVTSVLTGVEIERALIRAEEGAVVSAGDAQRLRGAFRRASGSWMVMDLAGPVLARAARPFPAEPLRTPDALHLATALEFTRAFADLYLLSFDRRIVENGTALGLI